MQSCQGKDFVSAQLASLEFERILIGTFLHEPATYLQYGKGLKAEHFSDSAFARIFELIGQLASWGQSPAPETIDALLAGAADVYSSLIDARISRYQLGEYVEALRNLHQRRTLAGMAQAAVIDIETIPEFQILRPKIELAVDRLLQATADRADEPGFAPFAQYAELVWQKILAHRHPHGSTPHFRTGIFGIDNGIGGIRRGQLVVIGGHEGPLRDDLLDTLALRFAHRNRSEPAGSRENKTLASGHVGFFALREDALTRIERSIWKTVDFEPFGPDDQPGDEEYYDRALAICAAERETTLYFCDAASLSIAQLALRARQLKAQHGLDVVCIDYLQLIAGIRTKGDDRVAEMQEVMTALKALAAALDIAIVTTADLMTARDRTERAPTLDDFVPLHAIAKEADIVLLVHELAQTDELDDEGRTLQHPSLAELHLIVAKCPKMDQIGRVIGLRFDTEQGVIEPRNPVDASRSSADTRDLPVQPGSPISKPDFDSS